MPIDHIPPLAPACVSCLVGRAISNYPADCSRDTVLAFQRRLGAYLATLPDRTCGPEMMESMAAIRAEIFGDNSAAEIARYAAIKHRFNRLMLDFAASERLSARIRASADSLRTALGLAMAGNFIDFGAMSEVDESRLRTMLADADSRVPAGSAAYAAFARDLACARSLVLLTDNCGEIVMDRLLVEYLREAYPTLNITVIVRGAPVLNDATMKDAVEVGFDRIPGVRVLGNGDSLAGTALGRISPEASAAIGAADLLLAKGQGNYETLRGCGLNLYYAFLCKCAFFADRFGVPLYSGMLVRERESEGNDNGVF